MNIPFDTSSTAGLIIAALGGLIFGVLLHRGRVTDYNVIVNLFRLRDFTVLRIMLTAILVGGIGGYLFHLGDLANYHIKPAMVAGISTGALIFGAGMVMLGYCPGTGVAAAATGRIHAIVGFLGMIAGGILYAIVYPGLKSGFLKMGDYGKARLPEITHIPDYAWWAILAAIFLTVFKLLKGKDRPAES